MVGPFFHPEQCAVQSYTMKYTHRFPFHCSAIKNDEEFENLIDREWNTTLDKSSRHAQVEEEKRACLMWVLFTMAPLFFTFCVTVSLKF